MKSMLQDLGFLPPAMPGLESVLADVAQGKIEVAEASQLIRKMAQSSHRQRAARLMPYFFILGGAVFTLTGAGFGFYSVISTFGTKETTGRVVAIRGGHAQVEFEIDGRKFTTTSTVSSQPPDHDVGDQVDVLYRPDDPMRARINTFVELWLFPVAFGVVGPVMMTAGVGIRRFQKRSEGDIAAT